MRDDWKFGDMDVSGADNEEDRVRVEQVEVEGGTVKRGDRVRLRPRRQADAFDLMLNGQFATIESIEQDYEQRIYLAVTLDDDPGKDLGLAHQIAHRFFFAPDEVQVALEEELRATESK